MKRKKRYCLVASEKQRESSKLVSTSFNSQKVSQQACAPQTNALKLANEPLSHKVWALFRGQFLHCTLGN